MMKSWNEIRKTATTFSKRWKDAYAKKSQPQSYLKEFSASTTATALAATSTSVSRRGTIEFDNCETKERKP